MRLFSWRWWLGIKPKPPKAMGNYTITALIPAYNEENYIANTIRHIQNQTVKVDKILVVDDCSTDNTGAVAKQAGAEVVQTDKNQGSKARAQQYAISNGYVETDLFVTIDADTLLDSKGIEKMLPYFENPKVAGTCGYVIPARIKTIWERGRFIEYIFSLSLFKEAQNNFGAILVSSGCFSMFRTSIVKEAGGFNPRTIAEDMDLTWEIACRGYTIVFVKDALCYPYDPPTLKILISQLDRWYRGFFQCFGIHRKILKRNRKLQIVVYGYAIDGALSPLIMFIGSMFVTGGNLLYSFLFSMVLEMAIALPFVIANSARVGLLRQAIISMPAFVVMRPINVFVFMRSLWREWIMKDKLDTWVKGHATTK